MIDSRTEYEAWCDWRTAVNKAHAWRVAHANTGSKHAKRKAAKWAKREKKLYIIWQEVSKNGG